MCGSLLPFLNYTATKKFSFANNGYHRANIYSSLHNLCYRNIVNEYKYQITANFLLLLLPFSIFDLRFCLLIKVRKAKPPVYPYFTKNT